MKRTKKYLLGIGLLLLTVIGVLTGGSLYMLNYALRPVNRGKDVSGSWNYMKKTYPETASWIDSIQACKALRDTFITAPDGTRLHAFYVRASRPKEQTAIIVHGYTDNAVRMFHIGYLYNHSLDYNILLPDLRYSGQSGGNEIQMGWLDRRDVIQWVHTASRIFGDSIKTVIHGISMGAATTMMVSGEELPPQVRCFVEDCGYTSVWEQFKKELREQFGLPPFPLLYSASIFCQWQNGWNFKEANAEQQVKRCKKPMLFIHGDSDKFVPTWMVYKLYEAKPEPKELWIVPETGHAESYKLYPEVYTRKIKNFTKKFLD